MHGEKRTCCTMYESRDEINRLARVLSTETVMLVNDCQIWSVTKTLDKHDKYSIHTLI